MPVQKRLAEGKKNSIYLKLCTYIISLVATFQIIKTELNSNVVYPRTSCVLYRQGVYSVVSTRTGKVPFRLEHLCLARHGSLIQDNTVKETPNRKDLCDICKFLSKFMVQHAKRKYDRITREDCQAEGILQILNPPPRKQKRKCPPQESSQPITK